MSRSVLTEPAGSSDVSVGPYVVSQLGVREGSPAALGSTAPSGWMWGEDSAKAVRVNVARANGEQLGTALVTQAEESTLLRRTRLPSQSLDRCVLVSDVSIAPTAPSDTLAALMYFAARRGRIWRRPMLLAGLGNEQAASASALFSLDALPGIKGPEAGGQTWALHAQRLELAIHRAWTAASPEMQDSLRPHFVPEAVETLENWIPTLISGPWFRAVFEGTLTKEQYIYTLSNLHQFVRWTTRLIGRAVSLSNDGRLRAKWIRHLREEVDHEKIIESDLAALGADVDFVVSHMAPNFETQQFMVAQESAIAFHQDPVIFEAAPFCAEGYAAHLDQKFVDALRGNARRWGVENPKQVTAFYCSHLEFDGGDDGHWELGLEMLKHHLRTDGQLVRFLNIAHLCMDSISKSYAAYIEDLAIYSASTPAGEPAR